MTRLWDLSRLHDRVEALSRELDDLGVSKIDGQADSELRKLAGDVEAELAPLRFYIEEQLGDSRSYVPDRSENL